MALLTKGGVFILGFWLPQTHSESDSPVSALMSGVVVNAGVFPLVRLALLLEEINPIICLFGVATALFGVIYAIFAQDTKRTLAWSTVAQLGFILAAPAVGGFYALTHGLVKSALFLIVGRLPSREFSVLAVQPIPKLLGVVLTIASLSMSGFPLLAGFGSKVMTLKDLLPWQYIVMNGAAVGTSIVFAKFIFLPQEKFPLADHKPQTWGFWSAIALLLGSLVLANGFYLQVYNLENIFKALAIIALGWLIYWGLIRHWPQYFSREPEKFEHLMGAMSLMLILLFWIGWSKWEPLL